uniref:Uncharacterized protein n=1 Tax=Glossina pallidipes TaxID=7398 RepID=A0A1A9Z324_GLOPL
MLLRLPTSSICNISKCCHSSNAIVTALNMAGRRTFLDDMTYNWRRYNIVTCSLCIQSMESTFIHLGKIILDVCACYRNFIRTIRSIYLALAIEKQITIRISIYETAIVSVALPTTTIRTNHQNSKIKTKDKSPKIVSTFYEYPIICKRKGIKSLPKFDDIEHFLMCWVTLFCGKNCATNDEKWQRFYWTFGSLDHQKVVVSDKYDIMPSSSSSSSSTLSSSSSSSSSSSTLPLK